MSANVARTLMVMAVVLLRAQIARSAERTHPTPSSPSHAFQPDDAGEDSDDGDEDDDDDDDDGADESGATPQPNGRLDRAFEIGGDVDLVSRYTWRGLALSPGAALQPEIWASYRDLTVSAWVNVLLARGSEVRRVSSAEAEATYELEWRRLQIDPAVTKYWFLDPGLPPGTTELGVAAALRFGIFAATTTQAVDVEATPGAYFGTLGGRLTLKQGKWVEKVATDLGWATAAYNQAYWDRAVTAFDLVEGSAEAGYAVTPLVSVTVHGGLSTLLNGTLRSSTPQPTLYYVGLLLSINH